MAITQTSSAKHIDAPEDKESLGVVLDHLVSQMTIVNSVLTEKVIVLTLNLFHAIVCKK